MLVIFLVKGHLDVIKNFRGFKGIPPDPQAHRREEYPIKTPGWDCALTVLA